MNSLNQEEQENKVRFIRELEPLFKKLQYRQELHDRFFHSDIYTLSKARRLTHLVLHHAKYVPTLYTFIAQENGKQGEVSFERMQRVLFDGFIVSLSMLNVLNKSFYEEFGSYFSRVDSAAMDPDVMIGSMIKELGQMAKTVEDIDHLAFVDVPTELTRSIRTMALGYLGFMVRYLAVTDGVWHWERLIQTTIERLVHVESKHMFFTRHSKEIELLMEHKRL